MRKTTYWFKFADAITTSAPVKSREDSAEAEVECIQNWSEANQMTLHLSKTWEIVVHGGSMKPLPAPIVGIERKSWLKLLAVTFQENPCGWDLHIDDLLSNASERMYILRVCRCYGYSADQLSKLFDSLIMSPLYYCIEVLVLCTPKEIFGSYRQVFPAGLSLWIYDKEF